MQSYFNDIAAHLESLLTGDEVFTCMYNGEDSDFIRFNQGKVRQAGSVAQRGVDIDLIEGARHAGASIVLSGDLAEDRVRLERTVKDLRAQRAELPEDPYLLYATEPQSTERREPSQLPDAEAALGAIQSAAADRDLVGLYAAGGIHVGFANSLGQRNWFSTHSYNFDWSFYHAKDKAVKSGYAGFTWDPARFQTKVDQAVRKLDVLQRKPKNVDRGHYRVYLTPDALKEMVDMLCWGGFGLKAMRTKQSPLLKLAEGEVSMHEGVSITEDTVDGAAPNFQSAGFLRPERVELIQGGAYGSALVSPRSAKEYGVETNGAADGETPESLDMQPGTLPDDEVLGALGTGLYVGNLHYLNWSDRMSCKTTGMTRFATFWVEDGEVVAPVDVMRFDESMYRVLGSNLTRLTQERDWLLSSDTYFRRSTSSARLPGALVEDFAFTL